MNVPCRHIGIVLRAFEYSAWKAEGSIVKLAVFQPFLVTVPFLLKGKFFP